MGISSCAHLLLTKSVRVLFQFVNPWEIQNNREKQKKTKEKNNHHSTGPKTLPTDGQLSIHLEWERELVEISHCQ